MQRTRVASLRSPLTPTVRRLTPLRHTMSLLPRFLIRALSGAALTCAAAAFAGYACSLPWPHLLSNPLEALVTLVVSPRYSDLYMARFDGYWLVRQFVVVLIPVGLVLGLLYGALLPRTFTPRHVLSRATLFSLLTVGVISVASLTVTLLSDLPVRYWPQAFAFHHVSVAFVLPYAALLHALGALFVERRHRHPLSANAA